MRVLVCGGRNFTDRAWLFATLDGLHAEEAFSVVIHGAYRGADTLADDWAKARGVESLPFKAEWTKAGSRAGPIRNAKMLVEGQPDLVVAFPGGPGTADMIRQAKAAKVPVFQFRHAISA